MSPAYVYELLYSLCIASPQLTGYLHDEMRPDTKPYRRRYERLVRGRIEFAKPAPHTTVLVATDEHRPMTAGTTLAVQHTYVTGEQHASPCIAHTATQV